MENRLTCVESLWSQFNEYRTQIVKDNDPEVLNESSYVKDDVYSVTEELYLDLKADFQTALLLLCKIVKIRKFLGLEIEMLM